MNTTSQKPGATDEKLDAWLDAIEKASADFIERAKADGMTHEGAVLTSMALLIGNGLGHVIVSPPSFGKRLLDVGTEYAYAFGKGMARQIGHPGAILAAETRRMIVEVVEPVVFRPDPTDRPKEGDGGLEDEVPRV